MTSRVKLLFVGGIGRSGTTLLERSLGTDSRVVSLGEVMHLWQRSLIRNEWCGCGRPFSECPFWCEVGERAFGGWDNIDAQRVCDLREKYDRTVLVPATILGLGGERARRERLEYASYYTRIYAAAAAVSGAEVVIDSSKQASLPFFFRGDHRIDLRVLHCVRDSRAVAYSWAQKVARPEGIGEHAQMDRFSPTFLAAVWMLQNLALEFISVLGVARLRLRYEDWVADPAAVVHQVLQFSGLDSQQALGVGDDWVELTENHTCSGNPMRFQTGRIEIRRDQRWHTHAKSRESRLVTVLTVPLLLAYRYLGGRS